MQTWGKSTTSIHVLIRRSLRMSIHMGLRAYSYTRLCTHVCPYTFYTCCSICTHIYMSCKPHEVYDARLSTSPNPPRPAPPVRPSAHPFMCPSICRSVGPSVGPSARPPVRQSMHPPAHPCTIHISAPREIHDAQLVLPLQRAPADRHTRLDGREPAVIEVEQLVLRSSEQRP